MLKPPIRWCGGKRSIAESLAKEIEATKPRRYIEPFLGGGAVALAMSTTISKVLSDSNRVLIDVWRCLQKAPEALIDELHRIEKQYGNTNEGYLLARAEMNSIIMMARPTWIRRAALFLYLNARCFNGLWRTNSAGYFNVPYGKIEKPSSIDLEEARMLGGFLRAGVELLIEDYHSVLSKLSGERKLQNAAIYVDPPYDATFSDYTKDGFGEGDQRALAEILKWCVSRGAKVWTTNSDTPLIRKIYSWTKIESIEEWHAIGAKGDRRGSRSCLMIRGG